ncbi:ATP-binding protein [Streptomyces sp. NPDC051162]|uniref:ATP-binding protein n=1 Tax=Streptomyces sp. NPDC051162 TaxID=3154747 RepID=UPI00343CF375
MSEERQSRARYQKATSSVKAARRRAGQIAAEWGIESLTDDLVLVVSEMVTNAVVHGGGRQVGVSYSLNAFRLRVEVRDAGHWVPAVFTRKRRRRQGGLQENGRGLLIVQECSSRWGCKRLVIGKAVWCEIDRSAASSKRHATC